MREIRTSGSTRGMWKRGCGRLFTVTAPHLYSTDREMARSDVTLQVGPALQCMVDGLGRAASCSHGALGRQQQVCRSASTGTACFVRAPKRAKTKT